MIRKYDEEERIRFFGEKWYNATYKSYIHDNSYDNSNDWSIVLGCSQRGYVHDFTLICLLFGVPVEDYKKKVIEYDGNITYRVYFKDRDKCEKFRIEYIEDLIDSFRVAKYLGGN